LFIYIVSETWKGRDTCQKEKDKIGKERHVVLKEVFKKSLTKNTNNKSSQKKGTLQK